MIGYDVDLPSQTASNQLSIGNLIMGTGLSGTGTSYLGAIGIGAPAPDRRLHVEEETATTNAVTYLFRVTSLSSGTPAVNIGAGIEFEIETAAGNNEVGATVEAKATAVTSTAEAVVLDGKQMSGGALQESFGISFLMKCLTANVAYNNVATTVQPWFPGGGAFTLEASTSYEFEGCLFITNGATTHTTNLSFAGTATLTSIAYQFEGARVAVGATAVAPAMGFIAAATGVQIETATSTAAGTTVRVRGIVRVNAAGTFIPSFAFITNAPGAGNVLANTFFKLRKIGSNTVAAQGPVT